MSHQECSTDRAQPVQAACHKQPWQCRLMSSGRYDDRFCCPPSGSCRCACPSQAIKTDIESAPERGSCLQTLQLLAQAACRFQPQNGCEVLTAERHMPEVRVVRWQLSRLCCCVWHWQIVCCHSTELAWRRLQLVHSGLLQVGLGWQSLLASLMGPGHQPRNAFLHRSA